MSDHITLPSGATADLRPVADITERHRRPLKKIQTQLVRLTEFGEAIAKAQGNKKLTKADQEAIANGLGEAFEPLEELNDRLVIAAVRGWSYDFPVDYENVLDLPGRDLDALREAVAPYMAELMPDFSPSQERNTPTGG
jgi:hypothetical protein